MQAVLRAVNNEMDYKTIAKQAELSLKRTMNVLNSARRILRNEKIHFGAIRGVGLHRLSDDDKVKHPESFKKRVDRGAKREEAVLDSISDFEGLSQTDRHSVTTNKTILNLIRTHATVKPEVKKITVAPLRTGK